MAQDIQTVKINELATSAINSSDYFVKADTNGVAYKSTLSALASFIGVVGATAFKGALAAADTPTEDGFYFASESKTYTNAGGLVVDLNAGLSIISVTAGQTVFKLVVIPIDLSSQLAQEVVEGETTKAVTGQAVYEYLDYRREIIGSDIDLNLASFKSSSLTQQRTFVYTSGNISQIQSIDINATRTGELKIKKLRDLGSNNFEFVSEITFNIDVLGYQVLDSKRGFTGMTLAPDERIGWYQNETDSNSALIGYVDSRTLNPQPVAPRIGYISGDLTTGSGAATPLPWFIFGLRANDIAENKGKEIQENKTSSTPDVNNKNILCFGDSITSDSQGYTYAHRLRDLSNAKTFTNLAIAGATMAWRAGTVATDDPQSTDDTNVVTNQVLKFETGYNLGLYPDPDVIIISAGINDVARLHNIGDISAIFSEPAADNDLHDFIAALRWSYEKLISIVPNATIFVITPLHSIVPTREFSDALPYVEAIRETSERLNTPVVDCFRDGGIYETRASELLKDGLHPNSKGQNIMGRYVYSRLKYKYYSLK